MHLSLASLHAFFKGNSIMMIMITLLMLKTIAQQPLMGLKKSGRNKMLGVSLEWHIRENYLGGLRSFTNRRALPALT